MAHFAELDKDNIVIQVTVVNNEDCLDQFGNESETVGAAFCHKLLGGRWVQTSYNSKFRKNYAGPGMKYDEALDAFIPIKMHNSWTLNTETCKWEPPVAYPTDGKIYGWDEPTTSWKELIN
jgi:hypothetical protein